jgi:hypothetical protein
MSYTALTIGPIYKTLKNAKKTREIWGASYFFSFVIKEIVKELVGKVTFITPYVKDEVKWAHFDIAGTCWITSGDWNIYSKNYATGIMVRTFYNTVKNIIYGKERRFEIDL